ncbi:uncharacterized protein LOC126927732 isoform X3 [Bombus affinis]|uniref:uncharacterized protein LOC126927732 isoform X3 n=1 Tax=Bombus affinis TaxID=309941 RepID=UPI0021B73F89|nr:uncharacterized protein LOC126927732 isoform X3 [Bombus affinis]
MRENCFTLATDFQNGCLFSQILFLRCCVTVCKASSGFHYIQNTYYRYLHSSYIFTSSLFSKSTRYVAHARHLPNVIGNLVMAVISYVLRIWAYGLSLHIHFLLQ